MSLTPALEPEDYEVISYIEAVDGEPEPLQESDFLNFIPDVLRKCRFCANEGSEFFCSRSHTFPAGLGNRWYYSWDECDHCNDQFKTFDDALCKALGVILTFCGIQRREGSVRTTGSGANQFKFVSNESGGHRVQIKPHVDKNDRVKLARGSDIFFLYDYNFGNSELHNLPTPAESFIPRDAYKALMKIGLSLLPQSELANFQNLLSWLMCKDDSLDRKLLRVAIAFDEIADAPKAWSAYLLRRKNANMLAPYCKFIFIVGPVCIRVDLTTDVFDDENEHRQFGIVEPITYATFELANCSKVKMTFKNFTTLDWSSSVNEPVPIFNMTHKTDYSTNHVSIVPNLRRPTNSA